MNHHWKTLLSIVLLVLAPGVTSAQSRNVPPSEELKALGVTHVRLGRGGVLEHLRGSFGFIQPQHAATDFHEVLARLQPALMTTGDEVFSLANEEENANGRYYILSQRLHGLEVVGAKLILTADTHSGEVVRVSGAYLPAGNLEHQPHLSSETAFKVANKYLPVFVNATGGANLSGSEAVQLGEPKLLYAFDMGGHGHLTWMMQLSMLSSDGVERESYEVMVDATYGSIVNFQPLSVDTAYATVSPQYGTPSPLVEDSETPCGWSKVHWAMTDRTDYYEVQAATLQDFSDAAWAYTGVHNSIHLKMPDVGVGYFRIRACNFGGGCSGWSITR